MYKSLLREDQLKRLDACVKDEHDQPLTCYGCMGSASRHTKNPELLETDFPGKAVEWRCLHCVRNPWQKSFWERKRHIIKEDADLYCTIDARDQDNFWKL